MWFWFLLIVGIILTLIIYFGLVPLNTRYIFLVSLIMGIIGSIRIYNLDFKYLGLETFSLNSVMAFGGVTLLGSSWLGWEKNKMQIDDRNREKWHDRREFYMLFSVPLQEFMARSYPLAIFKYT